jgi:hypothetical protein
MKTVLASLAVVVFLGMAGAGEKTDKKAAVKPAAGPSALKPPPELDQLRVFLGAWQCTGTDFAGPLGPEHPMQQTVKARMDLDGFWLIERLEEKKTKENPRPLKGVYAKAYDPGQKKFVATWNDNTGGWSTQTSDGWEGDKFVLLGDYTSNGEKMPTRDIYIKSSARELVHTVELKVKDQWSKLVEETCKK